MNALDRLLPAPRLVEIDAVEVGASPERAWEAVRHGDLATSPLVRALFSIRTRSSEPLLVLDEMVSSREHPGFQMLIDEPPRVLAVGAIGKVWMADIPFVHVDGPEAFLAYQEPGEVKVAWSIDVAPLGNGGARITVELRVDATDDFTWKKFRRYFALIGPGSRFIRHSLLAELGRKLGRLDSHDDDRRLPGDELIDPRVQVTHGTTIRAKPEAIWPWLVQLGCRRAGFYSIDALDNGLEPSAREIHPDLQDIRVGQILPATPDGKDGFEVLQIHPRRALVLGGLYDTVAKRQLPFYGERPEKYWHVTWTLALVPIDDERTRLIARGRVAYAGNARVLWMWPAHAMMQTAQLRHIAARAEGRLARDTWRDVVSGVGGAALIVADVVTPFLRHARSHWGVSEEDAARVHPGDELVPAPTWQWTHGIEIERTCDDVWPWIAQIGADRAGFYSYQWLENLAGCNLRNAEAVHPEWAVKEGDALLLHPKMPPMRVVSIAPGRGFVAAEKGVSWAFLLEPRGAGRCRLVSRFRCVNISSLLLEPVGFAMDRRMLLGVKERAERR